MVCEVVFRSIVGFGAEDDQIDIIPELVLASVIPITESIQNQVKPHLRGDEAFVVRSYFLIDPLEEQATSIPFLLDQHAQSIIKPFLFYLIKSFW